MRRLNHNPELFKYALRLLCICCILPSFSSYANNPHSVSEHQSEVLKQAQAAFNQGHHSDAVVQWRELAESGHAQAQVLLGLAYINAWGVRRNTKKAEHWYLKAASANNASAQLLLGLLYVVSDDNAKASKGIFWLQRAAKNGQASAVEFLQKAKQNQWLAHLKLVQANTGHSLP